MLKEILVWGQKSKWNLAKTGSTEQKRGLRLDLNEIRKSDYDSSLESKVRTNAMLKKKEPR